MAAATATSHSRHGSITTLDCDVNPNFSFPARNLAERPRSTCFAFPSSSSWAMNDSVSAFPRRGSLPLDSLVAPSMDSAHLRSQSHSRGRSIVDGAAPTMLNASVRLGQHSREASDLLQVPALDPKAEESEPVKKAAPPPPGAKRGHQHRRSKAISSSDVWTVIKESKDAAPPLPGAVADVTLSPRHSPRLSSAVSVSPDTLLGKLPIKYSIGSLADDSIATSPLPSPEMSTGSTESLSRNRVSFVETIEVIPQPPTPIMTPATEIANPFMAPLPTGITPPPPSELTPSPTRRNRSRSNSQTMTQPTAALRAQCDRDANERPSTAGAVLASPSDAPPAPKEPVPPLPAIPARLAVPEVPSLKKPASAELLGQFDKKASKSKKSHQKSKSDFGALTSATLSPVADLHDSEGSKKKSKKGKKKVKNWAGNIKGKLRHPKGSKKSKRAPTPEVQNLEEKSSAEQEWIATSWNDSYVIMPLESSPTIDLGFGEASAGSPVIDLDAALGPFKTPLNRAPVDRRRRMHSSGGRGTGGYFFHSRTASLPEMQSPKFDADREHIMEDVFEEEEDDSSDSSSSDEDSDDDQESRTSSETSTTGLGIQELITSPLQTEKTDSSDDRSTIKDNRLSSATITISSPPSSQSTTPTPYDRPRSSISLRRQKQPADIITTATITPASSSSSSPTSPRNNVFTQHPPPDSPHTFVTCASSSNGASSRTPTFPDFPASPLSDDSRYTESSGPDPKQGSFNPYNDYLGEPGPEMRLSVDDIPSLTSSSSIMTVNGGMPSTPGTGEGMPPMTPVSQMTGGSKRSKRSERKLEKAERKAAKKDMLLQEGEKERKWLKVWGFWRR